MYFKFGYQILNVNIVSLQKVDKPRGVLSGKVDKFIHFFVIFVSLKYIFCSIKLLSRHNKNNYEKL